MRRKLTITLLSMFLLLGIWQLTANVSAQEPFTLAKILTALQTKGNNPETATLAARNVYITKRVQTFGVNFQLTPDRERDLRDAGATNALIAAIRANGPAAPTPTPYTSNKPSASFKDIWVDYDVKEANQLGMRIHVKFSTYGMKNLNSYLAIYFKNEDNDTYLKDKNGKFNSSSDDVAIYREMTPAYDPADYNDLSVFMPYSEFDLTDGNWNLQMDVKLIYKEGGLIQELTTKSFNYKQGNTTNRNSSSVTSKVNRVWVDYNVTEDGKRGMRIHVNFEVTGLKGVDSKLVARVQKEDGTYLKSNNNSFSNDSGQLELAFEMNPGYPTTVYKDADMFLPYGEVNVSSGKYNLKLDIDLSYDDGTLIKHLEFYEFEFERP